MGQKTAPRAVTVVRMEGRKPFEAIGHPQVISLLLGRARAGGWPFEYMNPKGKVKRIPAKKIKEGRCGLKKDKAL